MHYTRWRTHGDPTTVKKPHRVPVVDGKKTCASCGEWKPLVRFPPQAKAAHGRGSHCYDCRSLTKRAARYGIDPDEFRRLYRLQGGRCAICKKQPGVKGLSVDHCHTTGAIRGLLCGRCNTAIGLMHDDPDILRAAIEYLGR